MKADDLVILLTPYVATYGYILVFLGVFLENSAMLGLVVPGETILIIAAFYAAQGELNIVYIMIVAFVGAVMGDNVGYYIGRRGGHPFIKKYGKYFLIHEKRLIATERYFEKHGGKTIFIARFTSFLRALAALTAGVCRMEYRLFFWYDLSGAIIWSVVISLLGYFLGDNWPVLSKIIDRIGLGILIAVIAVIAVGVLIRRRFKVEKDV
jgi:undecaprenyl-diphosphatase